MNRIATSLESARRQSHLRTVFLIMLMVFIHGVMLGLMVTAELRAEEHGITSKAVRRTPRVSHGEKYDLKKGDLYALVVGVSNYNIPRLDLKYSAKDAEDFAKFLRTQRKVFKEIHVKLLLNEKATKREVEKYLYHELLKAGKDDTIILFFSGHGGSDTSSPGQFYFLTCDADPKFLHATAVNMTGLNFFDRLDSKRLLLIADACHAAGFSQIRTRSIEDPLETYMRRFSATSGRVILTSSKPNEQSQEKPNLKNGVFTHYLLRGLQGEADTDRDGIVSLQEAYDYVYERTKDETNGHQHPQREGSEVGPFPISVLGKLDDTVKLDVWFVAQDPRCVNPHCLNPPEGFTECTDPLCGDVTITNGSEMYSGQNYQIGLRPHARSYVYVYQIDSRGNIFRLFPGRDYLGPENRMKNPLEGNKIYWIPGKFRWLSLDDREGKEKIYVVAARSKNARLESLYQDVERLRKGGGNRTESKELQAAQEEAIEGIMGVSKKISRKAKPALSDVSGLGKLQAFEKLSEVVESAGLDVGRSIWVWHKARKGGR